VIPATSTAQKLPWPNFTKCKANQAPSKFKYSVFAEIIMIMTLQKNKKNALKLIASLKSSVANGHRHETMTNKSTHPLHSARADLFHFSAAPPSAAVAAVVSDRRKLEKSK
jgi:hypothetical protein